MRETSPSPAAQSSVTGRETDRSWLPIALWTVIPVMLWAGVFIPLWMGGWQVEVENGPMENLQTLFLVLGCFLWCLSLRRTAGGARVLAAGLGLLYLNFVALEVDLRRYDAPVINTILDGVVRTIWMGALWIAAAGWFFRHRQATWRVFRRWLPTPEGTWLVAAGIIWGFSNTIEKLHVIEPRALGVFVEEMLEIGSCWMMLVVAVRFWRKPPAE